jgi:hypothetical protein
MSRTPNFVLVSLLQLSLCSPMLPGQSACKAPAVCDNSVKNACVNICTAACADIGECIFGCEIGGINNIDTCASSCTGLGTPCLNSCLATVQCISLGCGANVTSDVALNLGAPVLNRATGVWQQTVKITNTCGDTLSSIALVLDTLAAGWTVTNSDGTTTALQPSGSPYKNFGDLAVNATATITLQFTRTGTPAFTYSPRVVSGPNR